MHRKDSSSFADPARLAALEQCGLLDTPPSEQFDRLTRLASRLLRAPVAQFTLLDTQRQFFKSCVGLPEPWATRRETPLSHSFCRLVVEEQRALILEDVRTDLRTRDQEFLRALGVVAYLGVPLTLPGGLTVGAFAVADMVPRQWTSEDVELLEELAACISTEMELLSSLNREQSAGARLQRLAEISLEIVRNVSLEERIRTITEEARQLVGAHQAAISLTAGAGWSQTIAAVSLSDKYAAWRSFDVPTTGEGIFTEVLQTNRVMRLTQTEVEAHPAWRGFGKYAAHHPPMRGWLAVPLVGVDGRNLGLIQLSDKYEGEFTESDEAVLVQLAQLASSAVQNSRLYEDARAAEERLQRQNAALATLARSDASAQGSLTTALQQATETGSKTLNVDRMSVWLLEDSPQRIRCMDLYEQRSGLHSAGIELIGSAYPSYFQALLTQEVLAIDDAIADPRTCEFSESYLCPLGIRSMLDAPIRVRGRLVGVLCLEQQDTVRKWTPDEQSFVRSLADLIAVAMEAAERVKTEEALRASEAMTSAIVRASLDAIVTTDEDGRIVEFSPAAEAMFGLRKKEVLGWPMAEQLLPPALRASQQQEMERHLARGSRRTHSRLELSAMRADGSLFPVEVTLTTIQVDGSSLITAFMRDITERQRVERALREAEQRFREVVENLPLVFWVYEFPQNSMTFLSPAWERIVGLPTEAVLENPQLFLSYVHPEDQGQVLAMFESLGYGEADAREYRMIRPDGQLRWLRTHAFQVKGSTDGTWRVVGTTEDITSQREVEAALHLRNRVVEAVTNAILILDLTRPTFPILYVNRAFEQMTGYRAEEAVGRSYSFLHGRETQAETVAQLESAFQTGTPTTVEVLHYRKDGSTFWGRLGVFAMPDQEGRVVHMVGIQEDVTEQKNLAEQFRQSQKMEAVGRLAGGVAHDFNNMLAVITGYTELLLMQVGPQDRLRGALQEISKAGERAAGLTRQLLALSRKQLLEPRLLNPSAVVRDLDRMLRRLIGEDVELVTLLDPEPCSIRVDPGQLEQVLLNLCVNARDAMPLGGRLVLRTSQVDLTEAEAAEREGDLHPGRYAMIEVADNGCGMDEATLSRIWEPFFTTKGVGEGTGLGLATVFGIVKQSGGFISVESALGEGATFRIHFPLLAGETSRPGMPSSRLLTSGLGTILLCEDESLVRGMVETVLQTCGYTVLTAREPQEALRLAAQHQEPIDLLLTDVVMPGMSGTQLAAILAERQPGLKILFMSGYTEDAIIRTGLDQNTVKLLQKPFSPSALSTMVREVMGVRRAPGPRGRLLLVDDDAAARETFQEVLEGENYAVETAGDGLEALQRLRNGTQPDLILLDLTMPRMNGWVFRTEQQKEPALAKIPVIVFSGVTDAASASGFLGAAGSLTKPVEIDQLLRMVETHIRSNP